LSNQQTSDRDGDRRPGRLDPTRIRLAAFDLDGTLLGPDLILGDRLIRAVRRLSDQGVTVLIVTGRMHRTAERYALELGLQGLPVVTYNGALVRRAGGDEVWWHQPIAWPLAVEALEFLLARGLEPLVFHGDGVCARGPGDHVDPYFRVSGITPEYVGDLVRYVKGTGALPAEPTKLLQVEPVESMPALHDQAVARFGARLNITTSFPYFLEFMSGEVSKGRALGRVCERLGVRAAEVAAFGDGLNDLDMIQWAGIGVAMEHGPPELLAAATQVAAGPPGEGVARFIENNLLE
jgi:Cof subfamily protein (haloacid dehalogenase superfamily)